VEYAPRERDKLQAARANRRQLARDRQLRAGNSGAVAEAVAEAMASLTSGGARQGKFTSGRHDPSASFAKDAGPLPPPFGP
jgi:urease gamma subunit